MRYLPIISLFTLLLSLALPSHAAQQSLLKRTAVKQFIDEMVTKHDFKSNELVNLFAQIELKESIIKAITRPAEAKPWRDYRKIFIQDSRIQGGVDYWNQNRKLLERAEAEFGVPPEIITAIIGVETRYGRHAGSYRVPDALATIAFDYPKRAKFFRKELAQYLIMAREEGFDPLSKKGSYAGAMGHPQFIPSSFRHYAIDFDGDGKRDLWESNADIIGSVAAYFKRHGWKKGEPVTTPVSVSSKDYKSLVGKGLKPKLSLQRIVSYGVEHKQPLNQEQLATLMELEGRHGDEHWIGLHNFYVITRYNHSPLYAMAVYQLSQEIAALRAEGMH
ncbi:lytic murein transglycosylase B [Solemya pervernicosa gill symbiont]|uniref:Lytic murein transglycosylase B n=2 Tax=Gammaproteobacteria incertae sedis TaxID=118884 RepID=A0A1T2L4A4_9GAMM|nr:lytic murein transglycosylase B [Candidatus Reidiella endopervernicosa]OOZ39928.1 lytic murein transglycosylase B [Solemya pervernicosa gill symbiont]QKQ25981.1 lytic murein transglycosylase B [Candidatus Reidiella endopervernicosa]